MFKLEQLDHVAITVRDLDQSKEWYVETLGMEHRFPDLWDGVPVMLGLGSTLIALFPAEGEAQPSATHPAVRVAHFAFRANRANFETARRELATKGIETSFQDHDISHSIYFSDPDGHRLEITTYEIE
jgi:catechol 2,3-dioxygenase-like lactoylglutathione lyase family enzyme